MRLSLAGVWMTGCAVGLSAWLTAACSGQVADPGARRSAMTVDRSGIVVEQMAWHQARRGTDWWRGLNVWTPLDAVDAKWLCWQLRGHDGARPWPDRTA